MKQTYITFSKAFAFYFISCLVCSLIFALFYFFEIIQFEVFKYGSFSMSVLFCSIACFSIIKETEKKKLLHMCIFLVLLFVFTFIYTFGNFSFLSLSIKLCISSFIGLVFIFRSK